MFDGMENIVDKPYEWAIAKFESYPKMPKNKKGKIANALQAVFASYKVTRKTLDALKSENERFQSKPDDGLICKRNFQATETIWKEEKIFDALRFIFLTNVSMCESTQDSITPTSSAVYGKEEQAVTLSCDYEYTDSMNNLQWYRQYSNAAPEFLVLLTESGANQTGNTPRPHLSAKVHKSQKRVDLDLIPASVSDSALYYCALQPTVTGKPTSLYKNLQRPQT
ncbi:hypothetical protein QTP70_004338 [Hemibagrus guttatus]|uniref:Ig-like domain-containing protein n=1 Tax=Hemibagrus guttatus TaxID=175788 RepID=A0AAE0UHI3_9TELE|nr:hypothetical protein QTP70_004338 [Hemibagrus guttatus]